MEKLLTTAKEQLMQMLSEKDQKIVTENLVSLTPEEQEDVSLAVIEEMKNGTYKEYDNKRLGLPYDLILFGMDLNKIASGKTIRMQLYCDDIIEC